MTARITPAPLTRTLWAVADEIAQDWPRVKEAGVPSEFGNIGEHPAHPYWEVMLQLHTTDLTGSYRADSVASIVRYFVENASSWRGPVAQRVKAELRAAVADYDANRRRPRSFRS